MADYVNLCVLDTRLVKLECADVRRAWLSTTIKGVIMLLLDDVRRGVDSLHRRFARRNTPYTVRRNRRSALRC